MSEHGRFPGREPNAVKAEGWTSSMGAHNGKVPLSLHFHAESGMYCRGL